jgi:hypothetical protein
MCSMQFYVIKLLATVSGYLWVVRFSSPIKLIAIAIGVKNCNPNHIVLKKLMTSIYMSMILHLLAFNKILFLLFFI